jgi:hypothetical protein
MLNELIFQIYDLKKDYEINQAKTERLFFDENPRL